MSIHDFIEFLKSERKRRGYSRREMAAALSIAPGTINAIENGTQRPTLDFIRILAKFVGKYPEELLRIAYPDDFMPTSSQTTVDPSDRLILEEFRSLPQDIRQFILSSVRGYGGTGNASHEDEQSTLIGTKTTKKRSIHDKPQE